MPDIEIRCAAPLDFEQILQIEKLSFPTCWLELFLDREFNRPVTRLWPAYFSGEPDNAVGYLAAVRIVNDLHLLQIATHPDHRRKGVASALLRHAFDVETGLGSVMLEVRRSNRTAISFYTEKGFDFIGVHKKYYSDTGEDAMVFIREF